MKVFDFSEALYQLKLGNRVARKDWNNGEYVFIAPEGSVQVSAKTSGSSGSLPSTLWIRTNDDIIPWLPTQSELLADDWTSVQKLLTETGV